MDLFKLKNISGNSKVVAKNATYAFIIKGAALVISFFSTPLFVKYFDNNEVLGVWYTMLSMLVWFMTFDLGIGNGIRNHLVKSLTANDRNETRFIISSGLFAVGATTLILSVIGCILILKLNLNSVFNISESLISGRVLLFSTLLVFSAIMLRFFLTTVSSIFYALQRSAVNNFLSLCVSVLLVLYLILFRFDDTESALLNISFAYLIISNLPIIIAGIIVFLRELKDCSPHYRFINASTINKIMGIGIIFFLCQIFYMVIVNTNEFFVTHLWGPSDTTDYTFYYKVTMLMSMVVSLALTPVWSMITKAYSEGNYQWVMHFYNLMKKSGLVVLILELALIPFLQVIIDVWLGKNELIVKYPIALSFACFATVFIYSTMLSTIVCGLAMMRLQTWCYGIGAILKIILIVIVAKYSDYWAWTVWINTVILLPYCILEQSSLNKLFRRLNKSQI